MKGVVLAGGRGTRLQPITNVVNKHVLPIYDEPLIYYSVKTLVDAGVDEILVISNADHIGKYIQLLEGSDIQASFNYKVQTEPQGIAHAVSLAESFVDDDFVVILGDNVLLADFTEEFQSFVEDDADAKVFLTEVDEPAAYGVASVEDGRVTSIEEKPNSPDSNYAVIGLYLYTSKVFDIINDLEPSDRGEYEITDVNDDYASRGELAYDFYDGEWFDAGTPEGLFKASQFVRNQRRTQSES
jgi:glucose-1-phosphate thymidylyltransferase